MVKQRLFNIYPIGTSSFKNGSFIISLEPAYKDGLLELKQFSHVLIFWWANQCDNEKDRDTITVPLPYAKGKTAGVFACRSQLRPNPIALTTAFIKNIDAEKGEIELYYFDGFEGTPIIDLKPYIPFSDRVRDFKTAEWFDSFPEWYEDAGEFFMTHDIDFGES